MNCPDLEELLRLRDAAPADPGTQPHVQTGCLRCAARLELLDAVESALQRGPLVPVPGELEDRVARAAAAAMRTAIQRPRRRRRELTPVEPARGLELALRGLVRQRFLYVAGDYSLDLAHLGGSTLVGHLVTADECDPLLSAGSGLLAGEDGLLEVPIEPNGDFRFEDVRPGVYALLLEGGERELLLSRLDLSLDPLGG